MTSLFAVASPDGRVSPHAAPDTDTTPPRFVCPITLEAFHDPVVAADGRTYERALIAAWFETHGSTSPMTNEALPNGQLVPNWLLRTEMQERGYVLDRIAPAAQDGMERAPPRRLPDFRIAPVVDVPAMAHRTRAGHGLPPLAPPPELRPLPPLGCEPVPASALCMGDETARVWDATGNDEARALAALDALSQSGEIGRERGLAHIVAHAACASVRLEAARRLGDVPSVTAVDLLCGFTSHADPAVAQAATFKLSAGTAQLLDREAADAPHAINRCLRDLLCHVQDRDGVASGVLFVLNGRAVADPASVAEQLAVIAAACHAPIAVKAWHDLVQLCERHVEARAAYSAGLASLQEAAHADVARLARLAPPFGAT